MALNLLLILIIPAIAFIIAIVKKKLNYKEGVGKSNIEEKKIEVFTVVDGNNKRVLRYTESWKKQLRTDYNEKSPYYMKDYNYFVDDLGYYWRSYDGRKTFIKEINGEILK